MYFLLDQIKSLINRELHVGLTYTQAMQKAGQLVNAFAAVRPISTGGAKRHLTLRCIGEARVYIVRSPHEHTIEFSSLPTPPYCLYLTCPPVITLLHYPRGPPSSNSSEFSTLYGVAIR